MSALRQFAKEYVFRPFKALTASQDRAAYLRDTPSPKLNLGCGGNRIPGWLNVDVTPVPGAVYMDASKTWPFADNTFDAVLCEHMIEHVDKAFARHAMAETLRVLKPGAVLRIVTPDMGFFARMALGEVTPMDRDYVRFVGNFVGQPDASVCDAININFYHHGHRYIYTIDELSTLVRNAGFSELEIGRAAKPIDPIFANAEGHMKIVGVELDALEAFAIEARKAKA